MKLLYLHNTPLDSQKSNMIQVLYMCDAFHAQGVEVTLALPRQGTPDTAPAIGEIVAAKIGRKNQYPIITFPKFMIGNRLQALGGYRGVKKLLRRLDTDICFVRCPQHLKLAVEAGRPTIYEAHNSLLHTRYRTLDRFWRVQLKKAVRSENLRLFVSISRALTEFWISQGTPQEKCISLHDAIDGAAFDSPISQIGARQSLGLPLSGKVAVYAGSLYEDRGIDNIIKLAKVIPAVTFVVLGGPEEASKRLAAVAAADNVKNIVFKGWVPKDQVKTWLFAADVLLLLFTDKVPTINYCSPLKMFEYMGAGRTIVGHAFPTIKEVLRHGETAYLAKPGDFDDLVRNLQVALSNEHADSMAAAARSIALREHTWLSRAEIILGTLASAGNQIKVAA